MNPVPEACALLLDPLPYGYDNWSNQFVTQADVVTRDVETPSAASNFDAANRLMIQSSTYDPAGNQTAIGGYTFTYDAENRLKTSKIGEITTTYAYDGEGRRVKKGNETYVYDAFDNLAAEYGGTPLAEGGPRYLTTDHLGSTRLITKADGAVDQRIDYLPFGKAIPNGVSGRATGQGYQTNNYLDPLKPGFTGKDRDAETGLDYFGARYYAAAQGRFTSADPLLNSGRPWLPQSWNRYAYALSNPLRFTDPTGLYEWGACSGTDKECASYKKAFKDSLSHLKMARDSFGKKSREYKRLDAALEAYGKEGKKNGVSVGFGDLGDTAAGRTTPAGDLKSFSVMFDPAKMSKNDTAKWLAIDSGHEGTHVDDLRQIFSGAVEQLSPFSVEYRGYESSAFVFQGLFTPSPFANQGTVMGGVTSRTLGYGGNIIWNTSWGAADKNALQWRDAAITNTVIQRYGHPETTPHNPWENQ
ncbi:MAG: RHS repeat-associated core domain-containing protein [Bryobacteraceae bacterium]|nr:RHS repeat-associated core domain-containing protein [Bryobacteraceae bacterium]